MIQMGHIHECVLLMDECFKETDCNMSSNLFSWITSKRMWNTIKWREKKKERKERKKKNAQWLKCEQRSSNCTQSMIDDGYIFLDFVLWAPALVNVNFSNVRRRYIMKTKKQKKKNKVACLRKKIYSANVLFFLLMFRK